MPFLASDTFPGVKPWEWDEQPSYWIEHALAFRWARGRAASLK